MDGSTVPLAIEFCIGQYEHYRRNSGHLLCCVWIGKSGGSNPWNILIALAMGNEVPRCMRANVLFIWA